MNIKTDEKETESSQRKKRDPSLQRAMNSIVNEIQSARFTLNDAMGQISERLTERHAAFLKFIHENSTEEIREGERTSYKMDMINVHKFREMMDDMHVSALTPVILANAMFISLILRWDAYFARLLRLVYKSRPEVIDSSDRSISFSELSSFSNIQEARKSVVESEIENLMRDSHEKHFEYLATKLGIQAPKDKEI